MLKKTCFILLLIFIQFFALAQNPVFQVITVSGDVKLGKGMLEGNSLKSGDKLYETQSIILPHGGYVSMIHKTGKGIELKVAGTYSIKSVVKKIEEIKEFTLTSQYAPFVVEKITNLMDKKHEYNVTSSISRTTYLLTSLPNEITLLKNIPFSFRWIKYWVSKEDIFRIKITDLFDTALYDELATLNEINLDISKTGIKYNRAFHVLRLYHIDEDKQDYKSLSIRVSIMGDSEEQKIIDEVEKLKAELKEENAINSLIIASFYESKGLTAYASHYLYQATKQAPNVEQYETLYRNYLSMKNIFFATQLD